MQFNEQIASHAPKIDAFNDDSITINGHIFRQPVALENNQIKPLENVSFAQLDSDFFQAACQNGANIILLGTGKKQQFLPPKIVAQLTQQGIGIESMSTAAACRTYALLTSERRTVWAYLWL